MVNGCSPASSTVARCWLRWTSTACGTAITRSSRSCCARELRAQLGGEVEELHRRAAVWLAAHGDRTAALRHVATGRAWDLGTQLVIDHWVDLMINGEMAALRPVLEAMPRERVDACPELSLAFGAAMLAFGKQELAEPHLRAAEGAVDAGAAGAPGAVRRRVGRGRALRGTLRRGSRGRPHGRAGMARARPGARGRRGDAQPAWPAAHAAGDRRDVDRRPRCGGRAPRACPRRGRRRRVSSGPRSPRARTSRWPACCAATSRAPCAAPTRRWTSPNAAAGRDRSPRPPPTACSPPSASSAINSTRPNASSARPSAAVRDTRERPLLAVHVLNRVQLLSDRGEHVGALDLLRATREQLGDWPLPAPIRELLTAQEGLLEAATGEPEAGRALLQRATASSLGRRQRTGQVGSAGRRGAGGARDARCAPG